MDVIGKIIFIGSTKQVTEKFRVREFAIELIDQTYPQKCLFQCIQDGCQTLDDHSIGEGVKVYFNINGREWKPKEGGEPRYFNSLNVWRIEMISAAEPIQEPQKMNALGDAPDGSGDGYTYGKPAVQQEMDDLPF